MGWSEYSDEDDRSGSKQKGGRRPKRFERDDDDNSHKQKRSGKRFHRKKSIKDENWPDDDPRILPRRR